MDTYDNSISNNIITNNKNAFSLSNCNKTQIVNNFLVNNHEGIYLYKSCDNIISKNTIIYDSPEMVIDIDSSNNNIIEYNSIHNMNFGSMNLFVIWVDDSEGNLFILNRIQHNDFLIYWILIFVSIYLTGTIAGALWRISKKSGTKKIGSLRKISKKSRTEKEKGILAWDESGKVLKHSLFMAGITGFFAIILSSYKVFDHYITNLPLLFLSILLIIFTILNASFEFYPKFDSKKKPRKILVLIPALIFSVLFGLVLSLIIVDVFFDIFYLTELLVMGIYIGVNIYRYNRLRQIEFNNKNTIKKSA
jgi:parallel beta-helix repeat protein